MEYSRLQKLILEVIEPLKDNPAQLVQANLPKKFKPMTPIIFNMLKTFGVDLNQVTNGMFEKINSAPIEFWTTLEETLMGVIQGNSEDYEKAKVMLGGVMNGNNQTR
jgi:hypothetical protein